MFLFLRKLQSCFWHILTSVKCLDSNVSTEDSGDEDDEDSVEDEDEEDKDDEVDEKLAVKPPSQSDPRIYKVLSDFQGEQDGDLSVQVKTIIELYSIFQFVFVHFVIAKTSHHLIQPKWHRSVCSQKGDLLRIVRRAADGWWLAQDSKGKRGVVPKTYLKVHTLNTTL